MGDCQYGNCEGDTDLSYQCSYCDFGFCSKHRLPENHNCVAVRSAETLGPNFRTQDHVAAIQTGEQTIEERNQCGDCSAYIPPEKDLCISCRRKQATMSTKSPDVNVDGSLSPDEEDRKLQADVSQSPELSIISQIKSRFYGQRILNKLGYRGRVHHFFIQYRYAFIAVGLLLLAAISASILGISIGT